jgi:hypothetical protein
LACAFGIPTDKSVAIQAANAIDGSFLIGALRDCFVAANGLQRLPNRGVRELPPTYAHGSAAGAKGIPSMSCASLWPEEPIVDQSSLLNPSTKCRPGEERKQEIKRLLEDIPTFLNYLINFYFNADPSAHDRDGFPGSTPLPRSTD